MGVTNLRVQVGVFVRRAIGRATRGPTDGATLYLDGRTNRLRFTTTDGDFPVLSETTGSGAPTTADYLVKTANGSLSAERVVTDGTSITWDWSVGSQAKAKRAALTGDVTAAADGNATTIAASAVTLAKMADIATDRLIGRDTAGTGAPEALTVGGGVEFSGAGGIQRSALTGDVTASAGSGATTLAASGVTAATYGSSSTVAQVVVDAKGRITSAVDVSIGPRLYQIVGQYYPAAMVFAGGLAASATIAANTYKAWPWVAPRTGTIDRLMIDVTTAIAASNANVGIWSDSSGAPGTVLVQSGSLSCATTGVKTATVSQAVTQGTLYWVTWLSDTAGIAVRSFAAGDWIATLGYAGASNSAQTKYVVAQAYNASLPAWPGGATIESTAGSLPLMFIRWSA